MEAYSIREAYIDDLDVIISLKIRMFEDAGLVHMLADDCMTLIRDKYEELYNSGLAKHFLAVRNGEITAMSGGFIKNDIPYCFYRMGSYGFIGDMYTRPEYRRKGLAQSVLTYAIEWLKSNGIFSIQLLTSEDGKSLYEKNGFTINDAMTLELA